jgi:hypothetical protein
MIRLRFVTGNSWISAAIRAGERDGWCTHVEAVMPDGTLLGAHLDGGVQARPDGYDKTEMTRELFVELSIILDASQTRLFALQHQAPAYENIFYNFLRDQLGKPYDTEAVLGLGVGRDWRNADSWFCSELIAAALEVCGYLPKLSAADNHVSPRDLLLVLSGLVSIPDAA